MEWNALGVWDVAFAAFCDGLAANSSLLHLDLRNNQIDHNAAQELALALRTNSTLQTLNLNWNNIGLTGGRALSESLQQNHSLSKVIYTDKVFSKFVALEFGNVQKHTAVCVLLQSVCTSRLLVVEGKQQHVYGY